MGQQISADELAQWLAGEVCAVGSMTRDDALRRLRHRGATELTALLALARALELGRVCQDPRALERIRVPADGSSSTPRRSARVASGVQARERQPCLLVVDDDLALRDALCAAFEAEGYRVYAAADGKEALAVLARVPTPHAILLDLQMPVMDGWELLARLKKDERLSEVPVAVVSGETSNLPREVRFIPKPVNIVSLIEAVETLRRQPRQASA
ncbi:MAG: response regulator [Polyangiaceae bacterium]